jgi:1-acyl-sn-glycerol-3-phosphate acyltransferase
MNVIPIDRHAQPKSLQRSLAMCNDFLQRTRGNLILYPEGTRSSSGEMQAFKKGAGLFAVALGVPVVPAYIEGAPRILPKGQNVPRLGAATVRFGEPLRFASSSSDPLHERAVRKAAVELLEHRIRGLSRKPRAGGFAGVSVKEEQPTISAAVVAQEVQNTKGRELNSW